jgi:hypothetical protein
MSADVADTPAAQLAGQMAPEVTRGPPLTRLERSNLTLLVAIPHLLQAIAVGAVVAAFLVAFGMLVIPIEVQESWIGAPSRLVASASVGGEVRTVSEELLIVTALLGGIVGLYFSGLAISDPTYRSEGFDREVGEVRRLLAVRAVYRAALARPAG